MIRELGSPNKMKKILKSLELGSNIPNVQEDTKKFLYQQNTRHVTP